MMGGLGQINSTDELIQSVVSSNIFATKQNFPFGFDVQCGVHGPTEGREGLYCSNTLPQVIE